MVSPKPGSPAFAVLAFLARNPGSTAEEIAGALRPAYQPTGQGWQVPLAALLDTGEATHVLVAVKNDLTRWRPVDVKVTRRTSAMAWIEPLQAELHSGDELITNGGLELLDAIQEQSSASPPSHPQLKN